MPGIHRFSGQFGVGTSLAGIIRDQLVIAGGDGFVQHDLHHVFRIPGDFDLLGPVGAVVAGQDAEVAGDIARSFAAGIDERELVDGPAVAFAEIDLQVNTILAVAPLGGGVAVASSVGLLVVVSAGSR